jgi:hypothetical protein
MQAGKPALLSALSENLSASHKHESKKQEVPMKTKESAKNKKQNVTLKDLKARKNPKGGIGIVDRGTATTVNAGRSLVVTAGGSNSRC